MNTKNIISIVVFCFFSIFLFAQDTSNFEHVIQSDAFNKERKVRVFLPERYQRDSISKFMVTYVLDAQSDSFWNMAKSNINYLVNNYAIIPTIVVGIVSDNRGEEFSPPATTLQNHFREEVFPLIKEKYRVDDFKTVIGHSWGGNFIGSTLFSENRDLFNAYIGISPSFGDTDSYVVKKADSLLKAKTTFKKYLYFSYGDVGRREFEFGGYVNQIDSLLKKYPNNTLAWQPSLIKGTDHWQIVIPSINQGLIAMSRNYFADQAVIEELAKKHPNSLKKAIENFYKEKEQMFGYTHKPTSKYLDFVANDFRDLENYTTALTLYKIGLDKNPDDVNIYVNLSDTYDKLGNKKLAKESFLKTQKLLEEQKETLSENFYNGVSKWVKEKLEELE